MTTQSNVRNPDRQVGATARPGAALVKIYCANIHIPAHVGFGGGIFLDVPIEQRSTVNLQLVWPSIPQYPAWDIFPGGGYGVESPRPYGYGSAGAFSNNFSYTGAFQTFVVPDAVTSVLVNLKGGSGGGGSNRSQGAVVISTVTVTPGETLRVYVGGEGGLGSAPGFNGGGSGGVTASTSRSGGGATDIRRSPYGLGDRLVVAGGGSGDSLANGGVSGDGGTPNGEDGHDGAFGSGAFKGGGATQFAGGAGGAGVNNGTSGTLGVGGAGGDGASTAFIGGGGGGGGYYGGGGGGGSSVGIVNSATGGGGSSYSSGSGTSYGLGARGNGTASIAGTSLPDLQGSILVTTAITVNSDIVVSADAGCFQIVAIVGANTEDDCVTFNPPPEEA